MYQEDYIITRGKTPGLRPGNGSPMNFQALSFLYAPPVKKIFEKIKLQKSNISSTLQKCVKTPLV